MQHNTNQHQKNTAEYSPKHITVRETKMSHENYTDIFWLHVKHKFWNRPSIQKSQILAYVITDMQTRSHRLTPADISINAYD